MDGTNNASERAIGWWIKERYRSKRGYKRERSVLNASRFSEILVEWLNFRSSNGSLFD